HPAREVPRDRDRNRARRSVGGRERRRDLRDGVRRAHQYRPQEAAPEAPPPALAMAGGGPAADLATFEPCRVSVLQGTGSGGTIGPDSCRPGGEFPCDRRTAASPG